LGDDGAQVGAGEPGHLHVRSPHNAARYWNKQPETAATMIGDWVRTGDVFTQDEHGQFFFLGRSDDILKVGGLKVAPSEIEDCLLRHPSVAECGVVGTVGDDGVTAIVAFVRVRDGVEASDALKRDLRSHVRRTLAPFKAPREIEFVAELPKTSTGKLERYKLRALS
jgi:acyl-coenzyme A synthetase/AMP-(fatty) acid ligase